jgi:hypothetical protein
MVVIGVSRWPPIITGGVVVTRAVVIARATVITGTIVIARTIVARTGNSDADVDFRLRLVGRQECSC